MKNNKKWNILKFISNSLLSNKKRFQRKCYVCLGIKKDSEK